MNSHLYLNLQIPAPVKSFLAGLSLWVVGVLALPLIA
jgi:hypothetical protein